jgi:hypothetical protein
MDLPGQRDAAAHFRHPNTPSARSTLSATTRLIAAATYLDDSFAGDVLEELVANEQRAVVPSFFGLDLDTVLRHALHARRLYTWRQFTLTLILGLGLILDTSATICWLVVGIYFAVVARMWHELKAIGRLIAVLIGIGGTFMLLAYFAANLFASGVSDYEYEYERSVGSSLPHALIDLFAFPIIVMFTMLMFQWHRYSLLADGFRTGSSHTLPGIPNHRIKERVEQVNRAQHGNVTVYSGWSPFLGSGQIVTTWSITVDLVQDSGLPNAQRVPVSIDPVDLHAAVQERVTGLRDAQQPDNERVTGLVTGHHVVATGTRTQDHAILDSKGRPYSFAEPETIKAIIRHPQGGVRYYQRVTVTADGKPVLDRYGQEITAAEDQEIGATSFMYFAVEGGMLYVEYVATVMPPIRHDYHVIDTLPRSLQFEWFPKVFRAAAADLPDAAIAPVRLIPALLHNLMLVRRMERARRDASEYLVYNYGARISVRERAAAAGYTSYLQKLDATKYSKFVERRMNEAVLDYLNDHGVDASEYRERVRIVQNSGVMITGGTVSGQVINNATNATVTQTKTGAPTPSAASSGSGATK